jgi:fibronectin-binding autotransporter adhesin
MVFHFGLYHFGCESLRAGFRLPGRLVALVAACLALTAPALAADGTWNVDANGNWSTNSNWVGNTIPGTTTGTTSTDTAWFSRLLTGGRTVTVDSNRNIKNITFDDVNSSTFGYTLSGGSLLLTSGGTIAATGSLGAHTDTISSPMTILGNNATYTFANDSSLATRLLQITGPITGQSTTGGTTTIVLGGSNNGLNDFRSTLSGGTGGGAIAVVKEGSGTWRILQTSVANVERVNETTSFTINGGTLLVPSENAVRNALGASPTITLANVAGAQLDFGPVNHGKNIGFGSLSGGGASGGNIVNAAYANAGIYIGFDNTSTTFAGRIISGTAGGAAVNGGGLYKVGTGTLTLTGSGNDAGGTTFLRGGGLGLDFSQAWTGTNILASTRAIQFEGGRLLLTGSSGESNSQTFLSTTVAQGSSGIALTSNGATGLLASLGAITRSAGGTLDITLPDGTQSATNGVRTTTTTVTNGVTTASTTAYLTVGGTTWGVTSGTNVTGLSSYATGSANYISTNNVDVTNGDTVATGTVNTLRFNGSNTLTLTGTTTVGAGGVLVTSAASAGAAFSGGTLRPGSGNELVLINNGSLLTVDSVIANNSANSSLTLSGTGGIRLNGNNTYTGTTRISSGTVTLGSATALGASGSSAVWIGDKPSAVLDLNGYDISIGSLAGAGGSVSNAANSFGTPGGQVLLGANSLTAGADNTSTTYGGRISGSGTFTKVGTGNLTITGSSAFAGFSGSLVAESGTLTIGSVADTHFGTDPLGTATVYLGKIGGGTANARLEVTGSTGRPIVLVTGNSGTMAIAQNQFGRVQSSTVIASSITGTGDLVIVREGSQPAKFSVTGLINHTGNLTLLKNLIAGDGLAISGGIGSNVVNVTLNQRDTGPNGNDGNITIGGTIAATGTISNISAQPAGANPTINAVITNASRLVQNSSVRALVLNAANTFSGDTFIQSGTLTLGNNLALQNSGLDTSGAGVLDATSRTTPTFGGLIGSTSLSATNIVGYGAITALALNPQSGKSYTYSGNIGNGAANMTLTKSGSGTQILSGSNSYSGATTVSTGMLQFGKAASLYGGTTASWTAANIRTGSGATLAFSVGGTDEFTTGNVTTLLTNLAASSSVTNGMRAGSILGFDTTNAAGGTFTITDVIGNTTGASGGVRGLRKLGTGILELAGQNTYTGETAIVQGVLAVNGRVAGNASVASGAVLGGSGVIAGGLTGDGLIAPGNSPGILTVEGQVTPTASTSFAFEFSGTGAPVWNNAAASVNDVLRLTNNDPFTSSLASSNVVNIYFEVASLAANDAFLGGFFVDNLSSTANLLATGLGSAVFQYFVKGDGLGGFDYNGTNYYTFEQYKTNNPGLGLTEVTRSVVNVTSADFAGGTITTGQVTQFVIVPEPGSLALAGIGIAAAAYASRRHRR